MLHEALVQRGFQWKPSGSATDMLLPALLCWCVLMFVANINAPYYFVPFRRNFVEIHSFASLCIQRATLQKDLALACRRT